MSAGRDFHVCGATTENARRASSVRTLGTLASWISSSRRAGLPQYQRRDVRGSSVRLRRSNNLEFTTRQSQGHWHFVSCVYTSLSLSTSTLKRVRGASQKRATSLLLCYVMSVIATKRFQSSRDLSALYKSVLIDRLTQLPGHLFYGQHLGNKSSDCRLAAAVLAVTVAPRLEESISETWHSATPSPSGGRPSQTAACQRSRRSESLFGSLLRCTERDTTAIIDRNEADRRRMHDWRVVGDLCSTWRSFKCLQLFRAEKKY